jgi:hypothetical protein
MSNEGPLTLSREELYELVWSKPIVELAKDFGLSDVALAKRCRRLGVPVPGRGYWARVTAGQTPRQPKLKEREDQQGDRVALTFAEPREEATEVDASTPGSVEKRAIRERIESLETAPALDLLLASAVVKRTAVAMKRPWRREIVWNRGERSGAIIRVDASDAVADRALRVCEQLIAGATALGWPFQAPPKPSDTRRSPYENEPAQEDSDFGCFVVQGETLSVRIDERRRRVDHVQTEAEKAKRRRGEYVYAPPWDFVATGELRAYLSEQGSSYARKTWKDGVKKRIEDQIKPILLAMADEAFRMKVSREERRIAELEWRRQKELAAQLEKRREANAKLIHELEAQAGAWARAKLLRTYIRTLRRTIGEEKLEARLLGARVDFVAWAERYVDQLDPLTKTPHDPDLEDDDRSYRSVGDDVEEALSRLLGQKWQTTWKIHARAAGQSTAREKVLDEGEDDSDEGDGY